MKMFRIKSPLSMSAFVIINQNHISAVILQLLFPYLIPFNYPLGTLHLTARACPGGSLHIPASPTSDSGQGSRRASPYYSVFVLTPFNLLSVSSFCSASWTRAKLCLLH